MGNPAPGSAIPFQVGAGAHAGPGTPSQAAGRHIAVVTMGPGHLGAPPGRANPAYNDAKPGRVCNSAGIMAPGAMRAEFCTTILRDRRSRRASRVLTGRCHDVCAPLEARSSVADVGECTSQAKLT
jgi:hypothetical protein